MRKLSIILFIVTIPILVVGCNKSNINLFDYAHKPAVVIEYEGEINERIDDILSNR